MTHDAKAWIFDLDGTLVRTQDEYHAVAESDILARHGIIVQPAEISSRFAGIHTLEVFRILAPKIESRQLLKEKWQLMMGMAQTRPIRQIAGAQIVTKYLHDRGSRLAIASASPLSWIDLCLSQIDIKKYFSVTASVDEVEHGKPAPDVFLLAAKRLGIDPCKCIAVEDGMAGVFAALGAGMRTYWLTHDKRFIHRAKKIRSLAELI